jgi:hypothetical protein
MGRLLGLVEPGDESGDDFCPLKCWVAGLTAFLAVFIISLLFGELAQPVRATES